MKHKGKGYQGGLAGVSVRRVPKGTLAAMKGGGAGLWADGPTSFFHNSRRIVTVDLTEEERDLHSKKVLWCKSIEKDRKGTLA